MCRPWSAPLWPKNIPTRTYLAGPKKWKTGGPTYEASVTDRAARRDVVFNEAGVLQAVEQAIPMAELPAKVKRAVEDKYPGAVLRKAEKITTNDETQYEVALGKAAKKEVLLSAQGKVLKEE